MVDVSRADQEADNQIGDPKRIAVVAIAVGFGLVAILLYASRVDNVARVIGTAMMFAVAALLAGGFLGFLFGIPRALTSAGETGGHVVGVAALGGTRGYGANTNLEQISDWLTKILVGVSLTQIGSIRRGGASLFGAMAPALGDSAGSGAFAGALTVYYAILGFILGWLATRLFLGAALTAADRRANELLGQAALADQAGEPEKAAQLRQEAQDMLAAARPAAAWYELLRRTHPAGVVRTTAMEQSISAARKLGESGSVDREALRNLFASGGAGDRIIAIGMMQGQPAAADFDAVNKAIGQPRSGFEQYHALKLALRLAEEGRLTGDDRAELAQTLRTVLKDGRVHRDRLAIANDVMAKISAPPP